MDVGFGIALAVLHAVALIAIGVGALAAPATSSRFYGIEARNDQALGLIQALGVRDLALGLVLACAVSLANGPTVGAMLVAMSIVAAADLAIVFRRAPGAPPMSLISHGAGAVTLIVAGGLSLAGI